MSFEFMPKWIKVGKRAQILYQDKWYCGIIIATPEENDRGIEMRTDESVPPEGKHLLSVCVYMTERTQKDWDELLIKEGVTKDK